MSEVPSFYQSCIDSIQEDYKYLNNTRYPEILNNDSIFSTIARFTPLDEFKKGDALLDHYRIWCNSVGIWVTVSIDELPEYVLAVRQANTVNEEGVGVWEIPSGHTEIGKDKNAYVSATRELWEETGILLDPASLLPLAIIYDDNPQKGALLFRASIDVMDLNGIVGEPVKVENQTQIFDPPETVDNEEISAIALIPTKLSLFKSNVSPPGLLVNSNYNTVTQQGYFVLGCTSFNAGDLF